jgi:alcohol dehydrogenase class IV
MYKLQLPNQMIFGLGTVKSELLNVLKQQNINRILLVTDEVLVNFGVTKPVTDILEENKISFQLFDKVLPDNPSYIINESAKDLHKENFDGIIAVGGGSVMDCAKALNLILTKKLDKIDEHFTTRTGKLINEQLMTLIAIPTTSGTGSEVSGAAGIKDVELKRKESIYGAAMVPAVAIVDGEMHKGMPASVTLATGLDALSHAMEPLFSATRNNVTKAFGLQAIKLIIENLPIAVKDGNNLEARQNMAEASTLAIQAVTQSMTHIAHGLSHATGGQWNIPHGFAVAHALISTVEYFAETAPDTTKDLLEIFKIDSSVNAGVSLANALKDFATELGLPKLSTFEKVNMDELDAVVKNAHSFFAPRKPFIGKELPDEKWIVKAIKDSM